MTPALVVSDVDGTLVDKEKRLTDATISAVARLRAAGVPFTVISARPQSGLMPIADALDLDRPLAAFNGGRVFTRDGTILFHATIPADVSRGIVDMGRDSDADLWLFADDRWFASDGNGPHTQSERITSNQEPVTDPIPDDLLTRVDKITFVSDDEAMLRDLTRRMQTQFGDRAAIVQSQTYYLDVTATVANKGDGVEKLAAAYDVPLDRVVAIGDQANDVPMLKRAGRGIAMGNAPDAVKQVAGAVTTANDEDGVAHAIDTMILTGAKE